ncbi:CATRA system-associated protein [Kutzneria sp. 744]|uniref:CATRA system-associated protein n=1 Tax=Kutzneria sp. (strain 744) TaxID=345341 RepID=UPI0003EEC6AA|nr:hypothetical protein KUTG_02379 [Kutzneria sp. 744]
MWLDDVFRQDAHQVLAALLGARRSAVEWSTVADAVGDLESALRAGDAARFDSMVARLERMTEPRVDDIDPKEDAPPPPPLRDRMVHLQRQMDVDNLDDRKDLQGKEK